MHPLQNWASAKRGYKFMQPTFYSKWHAGLDVIVSNAPVVAPFQGGAVKGYTRDGGNTIYFYPDGMNLVMRFLHLAKIIKTGRVGRGEQIAISGNTGKRTKGPHLHIDISKGNVLLGNKYNFLNPETFNWFNTNNDNMFIRRSDGQISLLTPEGRRFVLSAVAWEKLGKPFAPTWVDADYNRYPETGVINDLI